MHPISIEKIYETIDKLNSEFPTDTLCLVLGVCRSAYYAWKAKQNATTLSPRMQQDQLLKKHILRIFWEHQRRYGARRIARELAAQNHICSVKRVKRLMREMNLKAIQPRAFRPRTTDSRHDLGYSPNLLADQPAPKELNRIWVGDITYIPLVNGKFLYLALLMDLCSRRIVGSNLQNHMKESLVFTALKRAIALRSPPPALIHHTDRGGQYAGNKYRATLQRARMRQSMSAAGNCYDNAFMESCFGTLKNELEMTEYQNQREAELQVLEYLHYYNTKRLHSSLNYVAPQDFENKSFNNK